ncbi:hypothetical protein [Devosia sp.]|uniref:hypothetical protein n=1 Tax=Devosia sp. TaxID=1871048 RepID=UPI002FC5C221
MKKFGLALMVVNAKVFRVDWAAEPSVWFASINLPHVVRCVFEYVGLTRLIAGRLRLPLASA